MNRKLIAASMFLYALAATAAVADDTRNVVKDRKVIRIKDGDLIVDGMPMRRGHLGVRLTDLTPELRTHFGAPKDAGVLVAKVTDGSPADKAGIKVGDIITSIEGVDARGPFAVERAVRGRKSGDQVRVNLLRGRSNQTVTVTIAEREMGLIDLGYLEGRPLMIDAERMTGLTEAGKYFTSPEWKARVARIGDCSDMQSKLGALEKRLEELEKKNR